MSDASLARLVGTNLDEQYGRNCAPVLPPKMEAHLYYEGVINYREENLLFITETGAELVMNLPYGLIGEGNVSASTFFTNQNGAVASTEAQT